MRCGAMIVTGPGHRRIHVAEALLAFILRTCIAVLKAQGDARRLTEQVRCEIASQLLRDTCLTKVVTSRRPSIARGGERLQPRVPTLDSNAPTTWRTENVAPELQPRQGGANNTRSWRLDESAESLNEQVAGLRKAQVRVHSDRTRSATDDRPPTVRLRRAALDTLVERSVAGAVRAADTLWVRGVAEVRSTAPGRRALGSQARNPGGRTPVVMEYQFTVVAGSA